MNIHQLDGFFNPQRIALIGVTVNPNSVGGKILGNLVGSGYLGVVYPVNPAVEAVMGIPCYPGLRSLPRTPDLGILCGPAAEVPGLVRECGEAGLRSLVIVSSGFRETGPEGRALEERVLAEAARFEGLRILGPNCLGLIVPGRRLNASFAADSPRPGQIAFLSQSGALGTSVLDWAIREKIGFSAFVSLGNSADVDFADLIDYFGEDEKTRSIILYIESLKNARRFMTAARAFARSKPIIVYKAGRFPESSEAAASHTGALASEDAVYDAAFQRAGLARVFDIGEIFDVAELLGRRQIPKGDRLGIVTNGGGPGVMAVDALIAAGGGLAVFSEDTKAGLDETLPPAGSHDNPVDVLGDAKSKLVAKATARVLADPGVDAVLVIITPQAMTNPSAIAREIGALAAGSAKPILAAWLGGESVAEGLRILTDAGIPAYDTPERAVRAFMTLVSYARNLGILYETPKEVPVEFSADRNTRRERVCAFFEPGTEMLGEEASKSVLEAYGIPASRPAPAGSAEEAVREAERMGYPVVLKIQSPDISHKTDVGGVVLDLGDAAQVRAAFGRVTASAAAARPSARLEGVTVQPMIRAKDAVELILGAKRDPTFGSVMMAGLGGTTAELFGDRALGFPPLNERLARRMLESLKVWPLLCGYRGRPALAVDRLIETMIRLSYLVADHPEIKELDINPLLVSKDAVVALDARIAVDRGAGGAAADPFAHLALRPYPEHYEKDVLLEDGSTVRLRPIKPEDEPLWLALLSGCSKESIYSRFRYFFHWESHDVAARYCYIDYDRELAIVAEEGEGPARRLTGVGRLVADPMKTSAEYAVLVGDAWQDKGLGGALTDHCLDIARDWGAREITAVTTTDNPRMIAVFRKRGFSIRVDADGSTVDAAKELE